MDRATIEPFTRTAGGALCTFHPMAILMHPWSFSVTDGIALAVTFWVLLLIGQRRHCLMLDLPGFGETPRPADTWSTQHYASAVADFLSKLIALMFGLGTALAGVLVYDWGPWKRLDYAQCCWLTRWSSTATAGPRAGGVFGCGNMVIEF